jgi:sporulation protein yqfD
MNKKTKGRKMFIKILLNYILGYVRITVEGYYIERFINICRKNKIIIWNLKRDKSVRLNLNIGIKDFKEIKKIAKKTKCKVKIIKKKGLPFLFNRYKKRKIFFGFLLLILILIGISSNFIWNIEIKIENAEQLDNIYEDITSAGLETGKMKNKINTKEIINQIRLKRNDIAWMGIELKGTNAIVKLVKAERKPDIVDEEDYCNIVSDKVGVITKINAKNGTLAVNVGDTVKVGTVLINGWMEGKYTGIRYVHAQGDIEAKVWYTKSTKILYNTTERSKTGNVENKYKIKFNNFEINLSKRVSKFKIYDTIDAEKKFKLFSDFYLPITLIKTTNKEEKEETKNYDFEQAKNLGVQQLEEELNKNITDSNKIVNKNINTYEKEDGLEVVVTYEVLENIGTNEKIVF